MKKKIGKILLLILGIAFIAVVYIYQNKFRTQSMLQTIASKDIAAKYQAQEITHDKELLRINAAQFESDLSKQLKLGVLDLNIDLVVDNKFFPQYLKSDFVELNYSNKIVLDLQKNEINGLTFDKFAQTFQILLENVSINNSSYTNLKLNGKLELINQQGENKNADCSILVSKLLNNNYLVAINFGNYQIKGFIDLGNQLIFGEYSAYKSDFEFVNFNFGLPTLFKLDSKNLIVGNFKFDLKKRAFEFITGDSKFTRDSAITGSIFSLHGLSNGTISWEYSNKNRWKVTLNDAVVLLPFRSRLTNLVFSQDDEGFNYINFNGEVEFYHNAFKSTLNFEQPRNSSLLKHHLIGKWDLDTNCWELNRLSNSSYAPIIKAKYRDLDLVFTPNSFKLTGAGEKSENVSFSYELTFDNAELKSQKQNYLIAYDGKLVGDCILKMENGQLVPEFKGSFNVGTADGKIEQFRYLTNNLTVTIGNDSTDNESSSWLFTSDKTTITPDNLSPFVLDKLTGDIKLYSEVQNLGNLMLYLNCNSNLVSFEQYRLADFNIDGALNLGQNQVVNKAYLEFATGALRDVGGVFVAKNLKSTMEIDRFRKDKTIPDAKWEIKADELSYNWLGKITLDGVSSLIQLNFAKNSNQILNHQITLEALYGKFVNKLIKLGSLRNLKVDINYPESYNATAEEFICVADDFSITAPKALGSLSETSKNGNFTIINGKYNNLDELGFCLNFDWSKLLKSQELIFSNSNLKVKGINFDGLSGVSKFNLLKQQISNSLVAKEITYGENRFTDVVFDLSMVANKIKLEKLLANFGDSKIKFKQDTPKQISFNFSNANFAQVLELLGIDSKLVKGKTNATITINSESLAIETVTFESAQTCQLQFDSIKDFTESDSRVQTEFALMALSNFESSDLKISIDFVGHDLYNLYVVSKGRPNRLLPFEYDINTGTLKKVNYSFFNLESTISLAYKNITNLTVKK